MSPVTQVAIMGHDYLLDLPDKRTLSIQWQVIGCGAYRPSSHIGASETRGPSDRKIDVYFGE